MSFHNTDGGRARPDLADALDRVFRDAPRSRTELKRLAVVDPNGPCPFCNTGWRFHADGLCPSPAAPEHLRRAISVQDRKDG